MNDNLVRFFKQRADAFPLNAEIDLERFLRDAIEEPFATLPAPAKIVLFDETTPHSYGFPVAKSPVLEDAEARLDRWLSDEILARSGTSPTARPDESLRAYRDAVLKLARNAAYSSILADYHAVFWLLHSVQVARAFSGFPRRAMSLAPKVNREHADTMKYLVAGRWVQTFRDALPELTSTHLSGYAAAEEEQKVRLLQLLTNNIFLITEEYIGSDLRELRGYFAGVLHKDFGTCRAWIESIRTATTELMAHDPLFRRAVLLIGYREGVPSLAMLLDRRVQQLLFDHPEFKVTFDKPLFDELSRRLLEYLVVANLRRSVVWMKTTPEGENVSDDGNRVAYSRALRPMNFGRRGVVEPIVYRFGLVYDITSFTQTLGEIARGGRQEEQSSYRQMLEFQRDLAAVSERHDLQFEKFLGDGAFYTARKASRTLAAAIDIQSFYASARSKGFAFNKGMRIAINYGYYRLLPMQITSDGAEIKEFYGPGIVELSRLTTGKATKELEDIQHLLLLHGYDQMEVYRFFAPLANAEKLDTGQQQREFYAHVNENRHLINEGIVASIPFLNELSTELAEEGRRLYRMSAPWATYVGVPMENDPGAYIGIRLLGQVSLKGIGSVEVAEVVKIGATEADISLVEERKPLLQVLQQERYRTVSSEADTVDTGTADLVVCQSMESAPVLLVGEWDPVSEEIRHPIQLGEDDAERYGLEMPITAASVETQSTAFQKLYRTLSRLDTLPSFSVQAIRDNANYNGFIIGATVEPI